MVFMQNFKKSRKVFKKSLAKSYWLHKDTFLFWYEHWMIMARKRNITYPTLGNVLRYLLAFFPTAILVWTKFVWSARDLRVNKQHKIVLQREKWRKKKRKKMIFRQWKKRSFSFFLFANFLKSRWSDVQNPSIIRPWDRRR